VSPSAPIQLPALHLTVHDGTGLLSPLIPGNPVPNGTVRVEDRSCLNIPTTGFKRTYTTNAAGQLANPGLPYSLYQVCAQGTFSGVTRHNYVRTAAVGTPIEDVPVQNPAAGTVRDIFLGALAPGILSGGCP
jgi:hypothetical protein